MGHSIDWSYKPYRPFLFDVGDIYVCRVAPGKTQVHFEWLDAGEPCRVCFGTRESGTFAVTENVTECEFTATDLPENTDFAFYVEGMTSGKKSRVRLARTGEVEGTVVNYLHPEDEAYSYSGRALCSPSFARLPNGDLVASMDLYAPAAPQNLTLLFKSKDNGKTWHYLSEIFPAFWSKLFVHKGDLYAIACSTEYGDLLIGRSQDGGETFPAPTVLLRGSCSPKMPGAHRNPQPVVSHAGRLWHPIEWGAWAAGFHAATVMSCDENADLLDARNWTIAPPLPYDPTWKGVAEGPSTGTIEGNLVVAPNGKFYNIMRYDTAKTTPSYGLVLAYEVNEKDPAAQIRYSHAIPFDGNLSKFIIKKDPKTGYYYTLYTRITDPNHVHDRRLLSLARSEDLEDWTLITDLLDRRDCPPKEVGFQYVDFEFDGDDIIYLCRTALNGARNFHDANYSVFHRLQNFRDL